MIIHGKEREFLFSIGAYEEIASFCPDNKIVKFAELFDGKSETEQMPYIMETAIAMNKASENRKFFEGKVHNDPLTVKELRTLLPSEFSMLQKEVLKAFSDGQKQTVETEKEEQKKTTATAE